MIFKEHFKRIRSKFYSIKIFTFLLLLLPYNFSNAKSVDFVTVDINSFYSNEFSSFRTPPENIDLNVNWIGAIRHEESNIPEGRTYHGLSIDSETGKKWQDTHPLSKRSLMLRKEFTTDKKISDAVIYISGLGHYELTLNGKKLGESQFDPLWSDYDKTVYYNTYNVTDLLEKENAIGVLLGNGFYNQQGGRYVKMQVSFGPPTLFFRDRKSVV